MCCSTRAARKAMYTYNASYKLFKIRIAGTKARIICVATSAKAVPPRIWSILNLHERSCVIGYQQFHTRTVACENVHKHLERDEVRMEHDRYS